MDSNTFNIIFILKQEIEILELCRTDKDDIEYKMVMRWLTNRIIDLMVLVNGYVRRNMRVRDKLNMTTLI